MEEMQSLPIKEYLLNQANPANILNKSSALSLRVSPSHELNQTIKLKSVAGRPKRHFRNALTGTTSSNMIKRPGNIALSILSPQQINNLGKSQYDISISSTTKSHKRASST